ncbi:MAG: LysM peptidoglycan-binding domain-containing protein [Kiritimatiellaeota bacterium]|nr:LysM peptidoglycan-binding domain-containing protein [Kiritimatiellota bacterium]
MIKDLDNTPQKSHLTPDMRQNANAPVQPAPSFNLPKPLTYQVRANDTLWSIAQDFYRDGTRADEIRAANADKISPSGTIRPGTILSIPAK